MTNDFPDRACYVYGLVPGLTTLPENLPGAELRLVHHRELAAVVGEAPTDRPLGTRSDLLGHSAVLDQLARTAPVLPMRFGTVVPDERAVEREVLAAQHDLVSQALDRLNGKAQFVLGVRYLEQVVLTELLDEDRGISRLRAAVARLPERAGHHERVRLGEAVARALDRKRAGDAAVLEAALRSQAVAVEVREPADQYEVLDAAFLVELSRATAFEQAVDELAQRVGHRMRLRLLGPMAVYDFVGSLTGAE
ncbi:GvpL/GvpF family gas vesicle protein [Kutzneria viridogrisea]|uniref:GvpL/GvpF family gas vesicle protein n=2 Tax=Kutzneria TaxID=43356 RepID=W5WHF1_9PSEU|nr:GvpL/GvpF family gas vesicle protein [Kutzneria albida]AHI00151.1 hypothetical protein KALB_6792 [Kutzneria albida DSM 43870]MBA8925327.1 hypothetical protein [Kutzneria viridogrisea]